MPIHVLRYDDYSSRSSLDVERPLIQLIDELNYPCTFSVIPYVFDGAGFCQTGQLSLCRLSSEKANLIRNPVDRGMIEIALHGWSHVALSTIRDFAEFSDAMPMETQRRLIRDGRACLEDLFQRRISLFVPPWNRLGRTTIEALKAEEMFTVSAGYPSHWEPDSPLAGLEGKGITNVPCWREIRQTPHSIVLARRFGGSGTIVGTQLHDYDFLESGYATGTFTMKALRDVLTPLRKQPDVSTMSAGNAAEAQGGAGWDRMRLHVELSRRYQNGFFRRRIWERYIRVAYWDPPAVRRFGALAKLVPSGGRLHPEVSVPL